MSENDWIKVHCELDRACERGELKDASEEQLQRWLQNLCTGNVKNESIRHREIIRGLTMNHIQMGRTIREIEATMRTLNDSNAKAEKQMSLLTKIGVGLAIIQTAAAIISVAAIFLHR
jgi:hypothetical protein